MQHSLELALLNQRDCKKLLRFNGLMNDLPNGTICTIDDDLEERDSCGVRCLFLNFLLSIIRLNLKNSRQMKQISSLIKETGGAFSVGQMVI